MVEKKYFTEKENIKFQTSFKRTKTCLGVSKITGR
jgi:hypothetical protein